MTRFMAKLYRFWSPRPCERLDVACRENVEVPLRSGPPWAVLVGGGGGGSGSMRAGPYISYFAFFY